MVFQPWCGPHPKPSQAPLLLVLPRGRVVSQFQRVGHADLTNICRSRLVVVSPPSFSFSLALSIVHLAFLPFAFARIVVIPRLTPAPLPCILISSLWVPILLILGVSHILLPRGTLPSVLESFSLPPIVILPAGIPILLLEILLGCKICGCGWGGIFSLAGGCLTSLRSHRGVRCRVLSRTLVLGIAIRRALWG